MSTKIFTGKDFYKAISYTSENLKLWIVIHSTKLGPALGDKKPQVRTSCLSL